MSQPTSPRPSKAAVFVAAAGVTIFWSIAGLVPLFMFGVWLALGMPAKSPVSTAQINSFLGVVGLMIISGYTYLILALLLRCPYCGFKFLRNPKSMGPVGFVYHPNCPKKKGFNPWSYQIVRFLRERQICCMQCGAEIFPPSERRQKGEIHGSPK